jgi:anti-sigma regulatory factor (Ser/Thr protein kinase)
VSRRPRTDREIRLNPVLEAPGQARTFMRHHMNELGFPNRVEDAALIAVELVTNALKHAASYGPFWLSLRLAGGRALIEVQDCSPHLPVLREPDYEAESGRGLHLVAALSAAYDWTPVDGGKVVWSILE